MVESQLYPSDGKDDIQANDRAFSLLLQSEGRASLLPLSGNMSCTFGRGPENTIQLSDRFVSRFHAQLEVVDNRQCYLVDLGSSNGTYVNDQPLNVPRCLQHGDRIEIGHNLIIFQAEATAETVLHPATIPHILMLSRQTVRSTFLTTVWQEVWQSQGLQVEALASITDIKQTLDAHPSSGSSPQLITLDIKDYPGDYAIFCRWCREHHPQTQVLLLDSTRKHIPDLEQKIAIKNGALALFPGLERSSLVLGSAILLAQINAVMQSLHKPTISDCEFLMILRTSELLTD